MNHPPSPYLLRLAQLCFVSMMAIAAVMLLDGCAAVPTSPATSSALTSAGQPVPTSESQLQQYLDQQDPADHGNATVQAIKVLKSGADSSVAQAGAAAVPPYGTIILSSISGVLGLLGTVLAAKAHATATQANATATQAQTTAAINAAPALVPASFSTATLSPNPPASK